MVFGLLKITKIGGPEKVVDLCTTYLDKATLSRLRDLVGVLPGVQLHGLVELVVSGQLFERSEKAPPHLLHRPTPSPGDHGLPLYQTQDHNALCHCISLLCLQPSHYREWNVRTSLEGAMGNYNVNAAHVPGGPLREAAQAFQQYLGLCRISFYPRVLRAGCHARATNAEQLCNDKNKKAASYVLDYLVDEDYACCKKIGHAIDYHLKQVSYFEYDYPEGLVDFVLWLTKV